MKTLLFFFVFITLALSEKVNPNITWVGHAGKTKNQELLSRLRHFFQALQPFDQPNFEMVNRTDPDLVTWRGIRAGTWQEVAETIHKGGNGHPVPCVGDQN